MNWDTYLLYAAIALLTASAAVASFHDTRITRPRRILISIGTLIVVVTLGSDLYINSIQTNNNQHQYYPGIDAPIITAQNKAQITLQAQADLDALLAPLWRQYETNIPGDYRSFADFKQKQWLDRSEAKTEYYIALATTNPVAVTADPDLHNLIKGFEDINLLAALMEQTLFDNGNGEDVRIMAMQVETLL